MSVRTTYFGGLGSVVEPDEDDDVLGVVRYPQDFVDRVVDRNVPALAPPEELLQAFKAVEGAAEADGDVPVPSRIAWEQVNFEDRYRSHLAKSGQQQVLENVRERVRDGLDVSERTVRNTLRVMVDLGHLERDDDVNPLQGEHATYQLKPEVSAGEP